jgi:DeoR/GlpR family transcriptional regulator of sugar metabolism
MSGGERVDQPLPAERHRRIVDVLRERHVVRVSTLSELLGVSEVTVRRDLEELEQRGLLERTHGGAILAQRMRSELAYADAIGRQQIEKRLIGEAAAGLAHPGDTVFLNGGTTTLQVFRHLLAGVQVVTNHVGMALESAERALDVILAGGEYRPPSNSCVGAFATEALRRVFATMCFLGVEGISRRAGLTTPAAAEAEIARVMIEQTQGRVIVVADHTKVGTIADFTIAPLDRVSGLVTDAGLDDEFREDLTEIGLDVVVVANGTRMREGVRG